MCLPVSPSSSSLSVLANTIWKRKKTFWKRWVRGHHFSGKSNPSINQSINHSINQEQKGSSRAGTVPPLCPPVSPQHRGAPTSSACFSLQSKCFSLLNDTAMLQGRGQGSEPTLRGREPTASAPGTGGGHGQGNHAVRLPGRGAGSGTEEGRAGEAPSAFGVHVPLDEKHTGLPVPAPDALHLWGGWGWAGSQGWARAPQLLLLLHSLLSLMEVSGGPGLRVPV